MILTFQMSPLAGGQGLCDIDTVWFRVTQKKQSLPKWLVEAYDLPINVKIIESPLAQGALKIRVFKSEVGQNVKGLGCFKIGVFKGWGVQE